MQSTRNRRLIIDDACDFRLAGLVGAERMQAIVSQSDSTADAMDVLGVVRTPSKEQVAATVESEITRFNGLKRSLRKRVRRRSARPIDVAIIPDAVLASEGIDPGTAGGLPLSSE